MKEKADHLVLFWSKLSFFGPEVWKLSWWIYKPYTLYSDSRYFFLIAKMILVILIWLQKKRKRYVPRIEQWTKRFLYQWANAWFSLILETSYVCSKGVYLKVHSLLVFLEQSLKKCRKEAQESWIAWKNPLRKLVPFMQTFSSFFALIDQKLVLLWRRHCT